MAKILISWVEYSRDFAAYKSTKIDPDGMHHQIHRYHYKKNNYSKHILMSTASKKKGDIYLDALVNYLNYCYPDHQIEKYYADITNPIDIEEIKAASERLLWQYNEHEVDIYYNAGYQMMQLAWVLCHQQSCRHFTRLMHMRQRAHNEDKTDDEPKLFRIDITEALSSTSLHLQLAQEQQQKEYKSSQHAHVGIDERGFLRLPSMEKVWKRAAKIAHTPYITALITGASGTGKEQFAAYIHRHTPNIDPDKYKAVNCAAYTQELLRSELFGHKKGAFTGADNDKKGLFEEFNGGTVFLDEIGDASPYVQQALLRFLQEGTFERVGESKTREAEIRIIAATNKDLLKECEAGRFRFDLYYRLHVAHLRLPALSELPVTEKDAMINFLIKKIKENKKLRFEGLLRLSKEARDYLLSYPFHGNIRQLEHLIIALYTFYSPHDVSLNDLLQELHDAPQAVATYNATQSMDEVIKNHLVNVLNYTGWNLTQARNILGEGYNSPNTLKAQMKKFGIERE